MGKGYIVIRLFQVKDLLPKIKANLKITNTETGNVVYEKEDAFDISGRSEAISVDTPDKSLSQEPNEEGVIPYGVYNIDVTAEGNREVIVEGVSVFDQITSIQNIEMIEENNVLGFKSSPEKIVIPEHQLTMKTTRDKQVGTSTTPVVLERVYIPEFIIVHLGPPGSGAEDVTVGFVDYIKNVASSEIYPTWPEESLKANIYCQISFALNRIYTEWYRNKGYPFQITNSTAYDQHFVKGRNIFDNISKIVDEIFKKYIRTIGNKTPFFAQYCNGTTVTCDGLSQWGTVSLANAGMEALDIIKYYFGYDKELVRAIAVEGIPESYPGTSLRLNDVNENVKLIQNQLNRISQNFPAIPKLYPDGIFGKETEEAVKAFQRIFNLTPDGIVGRGTWYRISSIYVGVKRLAELEQEPEIEGQPETPEGDGVYPGYLLKYGARGEKVREFQYYLGRIAEQYNIPRILPDGIFGIATKEAVMAFQRLFGLSQDGIVGPATWNKMVEIYRGLRRTNLYDNYIYSSEYPGYVLKEGLANEDIKWLQTHLNEIAEFYREIPKVNVDGIFGTNTRNSVRAFQKLFDLNVTGEIGVNDWEKLIQVRNSLDSIEDLKLIPPPEFDIELGDKDGYVTILQRYINILAKNNYKVNEVNVTGEFDEYTKKAVEDIQRELGLNVTGKVDRVTWNKIQAITEALYSGKNTRGI
ncbi:spore cortex-lytic protein [Clostridium perfringens]|nr:spore cortex-lytic protein [Clostridium perfringens]